MHAFDPVLMLLFTTLNFPHFGKKSGNPEKITDVVF